MRNNCSEVLLEITSICEPNDVYILTDSIYTIFKGVKVSPRVTANVANIVTELANNILDHSGSSGYVAIQYYKKVKLLKWP